MAILHMNANSAPFLPGPFPGPVFLVGARAVGKSTIGPLLAARLGWSFADTDAHIEALCGKSAAAVIQQEGWEAFRQKEMLALRQASQPRQVVATGGGAILKPENRSFMRGQGLVLYLHAKAEILAARLSDHRESGKRPARAGSHPALEIFEDVRLRDPLYRETAHLVVEAALAVPDVLASMLAALERFCSVPR